VARSVLRVDAADIERMIGSLYIEGPVTGRPASRFWVLLILAGIIAAAGLVADSTATVIGAMIVAPLMTPILGVALSVVLSDRPHLVRSLAFVVGGAITVIAIGTVFALIDRPADAFAGNTQIEARISPRLVDLIAALATGMVGAFALVRSDISDTLPGVAIAISLVPPLAVVGLLLGVGRVDDSLHAMLLFLTNVAAIIATGTVVLVLYRVRAAAMSAGRPVGALSRATLVSIAALLLLVAIPLAVGSASIARDEGLAAQARPIASAWARAAGWSLVDIEARNEVIVVTAFGPPPEIDPASLRVALDEAGLGSDDLTMHLIVGGSRYCPSGRNICQATPPG
jgi:uncharacterized hydrophobic protein (TIGR00271 family)